MSVDASPISSQPAKNSGEVIESVEHVSVSVAPILQASKVTPRQTSVSRSVRLSDSHSDRSYTRGHSVSSNIDDLDTDSTEVRRAQRRERRQRTISSSPESERRPSRSGSATRTGSTTREFRYRHKHYDSALIPTYKYDLIQRL